jgi:restriction endonuclease Mrr
MRQLLYYRKTKDLISIEEYDKLMIEYKIMVYEHKIVKLKEELGEKKE